MSSLRQNLGSVVRSNDVLYRFAKMARDIRGFPLIRTGAVSRVSLISKIYTRTMLHPVRLFTICDAVEEVHEKGIAGDLVECGVWSAGGLALMALWDLPQGTSRRYHASDSFEGPRPPTAEDSEVYERFVPNRGEERVAAAGQLVRTGVCQGDGADSVCQFFHRLGIPRERSVFQVGCFQDTVPIAAKTIGPIAILRIDGDWYESIRVCLEYLYDLVSPGGWVIIDDYGAFSGCRKAVDEFLANRGIVTAIEVVDNECVMFRVPLGERPN